MIPLLWTVFALVSIGLLIAAPRWLGADPLVDAIAWLRGSPQALPVTGESLAALAPLEDIDRGLKDLGEHIEAVRGLAEERGSELERFREGYDFAVTRAFARGVIKAIDLIGDFREQLADRHGDDESPVLKDALSRLEATAMHLELLLESNHIEPFHPEPGAAIEADSRRYEPVGKHPTERVEDHGRVASVKYPGWVLVIGDAQVRVVREAQVTVFSPVDPGDPIGPSDQIDPSDEGRA